MSETDNPKQATTIKLYLMQELLHSPEEILTQLPLSTTGKASISTFRNTITSILQGHDPRLLLIVGPCSIHNIDAAHRYATMLAKLAKDVEETFFIVMRAYFEKPRTHYGWKGLLIDPDLNGSCNVAKGIILARQFLLDLVELGLPAATEFVEPLTASFIQDLISWGAIGARTVQSPLHRQLASDLPMPIGFKNRTDGNVEVAIQAAQAASQAQSYLTLNMKGLLINKKTHGNTLPHIVLRGGEKTENFQRSSIEQIKALLQLLNVSFPIIVDAAHDNSKKNIKQQAYVFTNLISELQRGCTAFRGIMLESFLLPGTQESLLCEKNTLSREEILSQASLTDPCLDWGQTAELIYQASEHLQGVKV